MLSESEGSSLTQVWTDSAGKAYQPVLLCGSSAGGIVSAGVAILALDPTMRTITKSDAQLVTELANFLLRSETARP
jgi:predicted acylesterase/phospholipase RssA